MPPDRQTELVITVIAKRAPCDACASSGKQKLGSFPPRYGKCGPCAGTGTRLVAISQAPSGGGDKQ